MPVLLHGALPRLAEVHQHDHVDQPDLRIRFTGNGEHLDHEQPIGPAHGLAAAPQDFQALCIGPVVQYLTQRPAGLQIARSLRCAPGRRLICKKKHSSMRTNLNIIIEAHSS